MNATLPLILGLVGTALTQLVIWLVARRSKSGRIDTSEAATLWAESQAIRGELRAEVAELRKENEVLRRENADLKAEVAAIRRQIGGTASAT